MPVPVNIQSQLNRIETELTLLSRKNKRKRTKRIKQRESIINNDKSDKNTGNYPTSGHDNTSGIDQGDESSDREEEESEIESDIEEPVNKKKRNESVGESVGDNLFDMTSFSNNDDVIKNEDEGNETLDNLMSLFSEEPA